MTKFLLIFFLQIVFLNAIYSQQLVPLTDETITVNSTTSLTGITRNKVEVTIPENTKAYIYRISIFKKGESNSDNSLFDLLQKFGTSNISLASSLAQFAVRNNDNIAVDAFIFSNSYDAQGFVDMQDGTWSHCKEMRNRVNCCFSSKECLGRKLYFGFRNNNIMQGLDVKLEVVALIDSGSSNFTYSYSITNSANRELKFMLSEDQENWTSKTLRPGYTLPFSLPESNIYFKIYTDQFRFVLYKINPDERYQILWNNNKNSWDLSRY